MVLAIGSLQAQQLASTEPQLKKIVIEEFTGIYCGYCPDGALKVTAILNKYPENSMSVGIHSSNQYSQPSQQSGHPDFRTAYGGGLQSLSGLSGFPAAMLNRRVFDGMSQSGSSMAMNRNYWMAAADMIIGESENSPVNIGLRSTWNESTRELFIEAEVYYTAGEPNEDRLHIMLKEDNIIGYQGGAGGGNNYEHNHVLRSVPTGNMGELISNTSQGSLFTKTYTFTVPAEWNILNCELMAFVTKATRTKTHTGVEIPAMNGSTATGIKDITPVELKVSVYPNPVQGASRLQFATAENADVQVEVLNLIGETVLEPFKGPVVANRNYVIDLGSDNLNAGIYFVRVQAGQTVKTLRLQVLD